jgi:hypothetical protein
MKRSARLLSTTIIVLALLSTGLPCGPGYVSPLFDTTSAPEIPYTDFAAGRLGIVKPSFRRTVLIAAYRHIAGRGLNVPEQQALVEVWKAQINHRDFRDDSVDEAVKAWVAKRKEAVAKEEKLPEIYVERSYGGYEFFPNCAKNAFETATETLGDRMTSHGSTDANVQNWIAGQDQVFQNCASGKRVPDPAPPGAPLWLQKDRDYQIAAAEFYSMNYGEAKRRFAEIAQDTESPWRETADYLIARALIRQASLSANPASAAPHYEEAEAHLQKFVSSSGKFSASAERLQGLIRYRLHPRERVSELAKSITVYSGENFRQDVIDYTWLLDKFESEALTAEEKRKEAEKPKDANSVVAETPASNASNIAASSEKKNADDLEIYLYSVPEAKSYQIYVRPNATDAEAVAEAERVIGKALTDEMKTQVRDGRQRAYQTRFSDGVKSTYEGGYYGEELLTPSILPAFLRQDEITEWLYLYQMIGAEAYLQSLKRFEERGSDLWLMTALVQANKTSTKLDSLIDAANKTDRSGPAYPTIAYHHARILLIQGKTTEARKLIDEMLNLGDSLPISARNSFAELKLQLVDTVEDFITYSLKKPYAFDFSGEVGTLDEIIAEQKSYFDAEYNKEGREKYEADIEEQYKEERLWERRAMFDSDAVEILNQHFPTASLIEVYNSPALPDYMKPRFAMAIWTRAYLLNDAVTLAKFSPELAKANPELAPGLEAIAAAKTPAARDNALLFFVVKNPVLSPFIEDGIGRSDNEVEEWSFDDWWCEPYDSEYSDATNSEAPKALPRRPAPLKPAQTAAAQAERKKLKATGDAPKFLGNKVLAWARRSPADKRLAEALYLMAVANGWSKYGCGNNEELRSDLARIIKTRFANTEWAAKLKEIEGEQ